VSYLLDEPVNVTCLATDAAGIATSTCRDLRASAHTFGLGTTSIVASATDRNGNIGFGRLAFAVRSTFTSLCNVTKLYVKNASTASSLCGKLSAAEIARARGDRNLASRQIEGYVNDLGKQNGKGIGPDLIRQLTGFARALH
jgi:hypothetical protein